MNLKRGIIACALALWACSGTIRDQGSEGGKGNVGSARVPADHRPSAAACPEPTAGTCGSDASACSSDSACTAGANGRCDFERGGSCQCTYSCVQDSDCPTGNICACAGGPYNLARNTCVAGNCRVDADCGSGGSCSPSVPPGVLCQELAGYYCHTPSDGCIDDSDCAGPGRSLCVYSTTSARWECQAVQVCF